MATLMNDQSVTFDRATSTDTSSATSSPASAVGLLPSGSLAGQMTLPFGPDPVPASLTPQQALAEGMTTRATYGGRSDGTLSSAGLQSCLESRLRARLGDHGSPEYVLTWKHWDMESGPPICALRARGRKPKDGLCVAIRQFGSELDSEPRTSDSGYSGWATPTVGDSNKATPASNQGIPRQLPLAGYNTPRATDGSNGGPNQGGGALPADAATIGPTSESSNAETGKRGALNPELSLWLMGYSAAWLSCGASAMRSFRK